MDIFVLQTIGSILILLFAVLLTKAIFEHFKMKADLEMYIDEYKKLKDERDRLRVKVDTINRIYRQYDMKIIDNTNLILEELIVRLPRIGRKYLVSGLDKKYILDLIFIVGARFSHENLQPFPKYFELKPSKLTIREASFKLLNLINDSKLFSLVLLKKDEPEQEQLEKIKDELERFLEYTSRLLLE